MYVMDNGRSYILGLILTNSTSFEKILSLSGVNILHTFSAGLTSSICTVVRFSNFLHQQAHVIIRHILYFKQKYLLQFQWLTITYAVQKYAR